MSHAGIIVMVSQFLKVLTMSKTMTDQNEPSSLSADDIMIWLRANPNFLHKYPEACELLTPPQNHKEHGRSVVDFQQFMVKRLREDRDGIIEEAREIVETTRANMSNQARIHDSVIMLMDAGSFDDFIHILIMDLVALLDIDIIALLVEAEDDAIPHVNLPGVQISSAGTINLLMKDRKIILESHVKGLSDIYGSGAGLVQSQVLLRLNIAGNDSAALLAFGSRDPDLFQPGQGTELILFLGRIIERCFRQWLSLSAP